MLEVKVNSGTKQTKAIALQHLGRGLHAIQDIHAHGQIGAGSRNITGHMFDTIMSMFSLGNFQFGMSPDSYNYVWRGLSRVSLIRARGDEITLYNNPRILAAIADSQEFLQIFINSIHDASWLGRECQD